MRLELPRGKHRRSILESTGRLNIWHGSVRSGKTISSIIRWLDFVDRAPEGLLLMVGKTERTLWRNVLDPLVEMVGPEGAQFARGTGEGRIFGRKVLIAGANDERAEGKIRGLTLAGAYGDEVVLWPESFFRMLLTRLSVAGAKFFGTTNPDGPRHWLKRDFIDRAEELDLRAFHFRLEDNPALDPGYIAAVKREFSGLWYRRFIEGEWVLAEGLVWDMFDPDVHVFGFERDLPPLERHWVAVDYGTANPFVALHIARSVGWRYYVLDEWRWDSRKEHRQLTDAQYSERVRAWIHGKGVRPERWVVDPSAASFIEQLRQDGEVVEPANNDVQYGLAVVAAALGKRVLMIHRQCRGLIAEIESYSWDEKAAQRGEDKPLKQDDHGPDALRYGMAALYRLPTAAGAEGDEEPLERGSLNPFAGRRGRLG